MDANGSMTADPDPLEPDDDQLPATGPVGAGSG